MYLFGALVNVYYNLSVGLIGLRTVKFALQVEQAIWDTLQKDNIITICANFASVEIGCIMLKTEMCTHNRVVQKWMHGII